MLNVTKENVKEFAASRYQNPGCKSHIEFEEDYLRIKHLKVILNKYLNNKKINIRILINHVVCIQNVFPGDSTAIILFASFDESTWNALATILIYLSLMPHTISEVEGKKITLSSISIDNNLLEKLREL